MKFSERLTWAIAIVILDLIIFVMPVMAVLTAYVILARPPWFKGWIDKLYEN